MKLPLKKLKKINIKYISDLSLARWPCETCVGPVKPAFFLLSKLINKKILSFLVTLPSKKSNLNKINKVYTFGAHFINLRCIKNVHHLYRIEMVYTRQLPLKTTLMHNTSRNTLRKSLSQLKYSINFVHSQIQFPSTKTLKKENEMKQALLKKHCFETNQ